METKKGKRKKTSNVKRPTTAYLYFVSKYRERLKSTGEPMPKVANVPSIVGKIYFGKNLLNGVSQISFLRTLKN